MYKNILLLIASISFVSVSVKAEEEICKIAQDSAKSHFFHKKEMAFYAQSKMNPNLYNYIVITKDFYKKSPVRMTPSLKDSSKLSNHKLLMEVYEKQAEKLNPLDTSNNFKKCYNQAFQSKLDSAFKCDFYRKSDSILAAYDKNGKGYSGVDFPGGASALQKYFDKNLTLPKDAAPDDSAKVIRIFYSFYVDEKGDLSEFKLVKSNCKKCEDALLEAIKKMPAFLPAKEGGKPKKSKYILPYIKAYKEK
ncbi:MAG TPA: hypothetical protein PKM51_05250 [Chitinophagales bacterium]|nr:hypothetical protein [Chitinophagales bacterium]HNM32137.1 hypothetical protein [Chitinophagales bacterium]